MRLRTLLLLLAAGGLLGGGALLVREALRDPAGAKEALKRPARAARDRARGVARRDRADLPIPRCPRAVAGCRSAGGRIVFVERVDPDGDGDLHVVVAGGSVTAPGLTAIDVRPGLRPRRDPGIGDLASAAGPVQRGSYGQSQIHALEFRVRRR
jgi:hypothetical protein